MLPVIDELQWAKDIFKDLGDEYKRLKYTEYSNKARMVMSIVKEAVKMKENTLIFVHSIPTLDYLREKLDHKGYTIFELTGQTPMKDRQPAIDRFNRLRGAVYLISCRVSFPLRTRLTVGGESWFEHYLGKSSNLIRFSVESGS